MEHIRDSFQKWKNKKGIKKWILPVDILLLILAVTGYFVIVNQYQERFIPGTSINGVDVSGMYEEDAQKAVAETISDYAIDLVFSDGTKENITGKEIGLHMLRSDDIPRILTEQNRFGWFLNLFGKTFDHTIETSVAYDDVLLRSKVISLPEMSPLVQFSPRDACLAFDENGRLMIVPEQEGNEIDTECLLDAADEKILTGETTLTLTDVDGIYHYPDRYADNEELTSCMEEVNDFLDTEVTITVSSGEDVVLDDEFLRPYLVLGADGLYTITPEMIHEAASDFIREIALEDDCLGEYRTFKSTRLGIIHMPSGEEHGHTMDQEKMVELVESDLESHYSGKHFLIYSKYIDHTDPQLGGTYIEIDIYGQHVYLYKDGELDFDTPCVTGTEGTSRATPSGIYAVNRRYYDTYLEGPPREDGTPSYRSHVDYFMAFYHGYGLHDATWRSKSQFGTDRYTYDGSHGCVNLPYDSARYLYKNTEMGIPVVVFRAKISAAEEEAAKAEAEAAFAKEEEESGRDDEESDDTDSEDSGGSQDESEDD